MLAVAARFAEDAWSRRSSLATVALAQPRGARPRRGPTPRPKASRRRRQSVRRQGAAGAARRRDAPTAAGRPAAPSDAGPVPPPPRWSRPTAASSRRSTRRANEFSDAGHPGVTVDYDRLLADIGSLRARVAAVSDTLFHSRIAVSLETSGDHGRIAALTVSLDDGVVWTSPAAFRAEDATIVYDHAVAPGHHAVTVDVERRDDRNDSFRSTQRSRFVVDVPADQRLAVELKLWDDSNMGGDFPADKKGDVRARASGCAPRRRRSDGDGR